MGFSVLERVRDNSNLGAVRAAKRPLATAADGLSAVVTRDERFVKLKA